MRPTGTCYTVPWTFHVQNPNGSKGEIKYISNNKYKKTTKKSSALAPQPPCQSKILGLDGHTLCVNSGQICVLEKGDEVGLSSFLKGHDSR